MKIVGLITEYNPFHNGHEYHIKKAKEITGADYCIAVMSGDFVQRGTPAFLPKHLRAQMALHGGCDMIIANGSDPKILYAITENDSPRCTLFKGKK